MKKKHFKQTNNRPIVFLQLFLATQTFFIFALLTNIEHHWDTKRLLSVNKRKQRKLEKEKFGSSFAWTSFLLVIFSNATLNNLYNLCLLYNFCYFINQWKVEDCKSTYKVPKNKLGRENQKFHPFVLRFWHS